MRRAFRYRLYPSRKQAADLFRTLDLARGFYNACIEERRDAWRRQRVSIGRFDQNLSATVVRCEQPEYAKLHTHVLQDATARADRAFKAFFKRVQKRKQLRKIGKKPKGKPGYPRFKGPGQYRTFTFQDAAHRNGAALVAGNKRLRIHGVGNVKIKLHRPIEGRVKTIGVTLDGDGYWYAIVTCDDVPQQQLDATIREVTGIDLGLQEYLVTAEDQRVPNPRLANEHQPGIADAQRSVARKRKGSRRRRKAVALLAKRHARLRNARKDFQHKTAHALLGQHATVVVEDLSIQGLARSMLARPIHDAAWGQFIGILCAKAESAGRMVVKVDPRGTSQECSGCGAYVPKGLWVRVHNCPHCGLVCDRDLNAARNVLARGLQRLRENTAGAPPSGRGAVVDAHAGGTGHGSL